jgi:signal-transduction protein with cAMP-binding, CBS, and nucleotidyltransferase domain
MSQPDTQMTIEALRSVPLFASLDDEAARELRSLLSDKIVPQNTRLFRQGDKGDSMYLIESGRVLISLRDDGSHSRRASAGRLLRRDVDHRRSTAIGRCESDRRRATRNPLARRVSLVRPQ